METKKGLHSYSQFAQTELKFIKLNILSFVILKTYNHIFSKMYRYNRM